MNWSVTNEELQIYLEVSDEAIDAALLQEKLELRLIYFVSQVLQDVETRYQQVEKVELVLLNAAKRLQPSKVSK